MPKDRPADPGAASLLILARLAAHHIADRWVQRDCEARGKGIHGHHLVHRATGESTSPTNGTDSSSAITASAYGRRRCAQHVGSYTGTELAATLLTAAAFRVPLSTRGVLVGQAISTGTHYVIDRRRPLRLLAGSPVLAARRLPVRSRLRRFVVSLSGLPYYRINAEALDQSAHLAFVTLGGAVTALITGRSTDVGRGAYGQR